MKRYIGRFAPSPTGALHAGSLVAALASWLDARAHSGQWLVRIEDIDTPRCSKGAAEHILRQLAACALIPDQMPLYQSQRSALYQRALDHLLRHQLAYPCACSRRSIAATLHTKDPCPPSHSALVYPGTCRNGLRGRPARAWRMNTSAAALRRALHRGHDESNANAQTEAPADLVHWADRRLGAQQQDVAAQVGDFVLRRADGLWAYQLAVVVDDGEQGISHIVRGEDLADNTARQICLQRALGYAQPVYLHTPLVLASDGQKLSKQTGAAALALDTPTQALAALNQAAQRLGLTCTSPATDRAEALRQWVCQWTQHWRNNADSTDLP